MRSGPEEADVPGELALWSAGGEAAGRGWTAISCQAGTCWLCLRRSQALEPSRPLWVWPHASVLESTWAPGKARACSRGAGTDPNPESTQAQARRELLWSRLLAKVLFTIASEELNPLVISFVPFVLSPKFLLFLKHAKHVVAPGPLHLCVLFLEHPRPRLGIYIVGFSQRSPLSLTILSKVTSTSSMPLYRGSLSHFPSDFCSYHTPHNQKLSTSLICLFFCLPKQKISSTRTGAFSSA